jgi:hypothetical protein
LKAADDANMRGAFCAAAAEREFDVHGFPICDFRIMICDR